MPIRSLDDFALRKLAELDRASLRRMLAESFRGEGPWIKREGRRYWRQKNERLRAEKIARLEAEIRAASNWRYALFRSGDVDELLAKGQCGILADMTAKILRDVLERVEAWPREAQEELAAIALEIDAGLGGGVYHATPEELEGIDRGLKAAREGRFASDAEVEAIFAKHRRE